MGGKELLAGGLCSPTASLGKYCVNFFLKK